MTGYQFAVTCPTCAGTLHHQADGATYTHRTAAIAACTNCGSVYRVDVVLSALSGPALRPSPPDHARNPDAPGRALIDAILAVAP